MSGLNIPARMRQLTKTESQWTIANPILLDGEIGLESDTRRIKIGDGTTPWNSLAVAGTGAAANNARSQALGLSLKPAIYCDSKIHIAVGDAMYRKIFNYGGDGVWSVTGTLPTGITQTNGVLAGTPTTAGTYTFTIVCTNARGASSVSATIKVFAGTPTAGQTLIDCDLYRRDRAMLTTENTTVFTGNSYGEAEILPVGAQLAGYGDSYGTNGLLTKDRAFRFDVDASFARLGTVWGQFGFWIRLSSPAGSTQGTSFFLANGYANGDGQGWRDIGNPYNFQLDGPQFKIDTSRYPAEPSKWYYIQNTVRTDIYYWQLTIRDADLNVVHTRVMGNSGSAINSPFNLINAGPGNTTQRWGGSVSAVNLIACADETAALAYPNQIIPPAQVGVNWFVDAQAFDAGEPMAVRHINDISLRLQKGVMTPGDWVDQTGAKVVAEDLTTLAAHVAFADAYDAGNRKLTGDSIILSPGRHEITRELGLEAKAIGTSILGNRSTLSCQVTLKDFSQPNPATYPYVWKAPGSNFREGTTGMGIVVQNGVVLFPVEATTLADALPLINAAAGRCWADGEGCYFSSFDNQLGLTDPRNNGSVYRCTSITPVQYQSSHGVVQLRNSMIKGVVCECGPLKHPSQNLSFAKYAIAMQTGAICVVDDCTARHGSYHNMGMVGNEAVGLGYRKKVRYERLCTFSANDSQDVTYTGVQSAGTIGSIYRDCIEKEGRIGPGEAYGYNNRIGGGECILWHGVDGTGKVFQTKIERCSFGNDLNVSLHVDNSFQMEASTCHTLLSDSVGIQATRCLFLSPRIGMYANSMTFTNCIFYQDPLYGASGYGDGWPCQGSLTLDRCTIDLRGFPIGSSGGAVLKRTATLNLNISNCAFIQQAATPYIKNTTNADTLAISRCAFLAVTGVNILANHNDGTTTAARTLSQLVSLAIASNSIESASLGLLNYDSYKVVAGSPVIGVAGSASAKDYTGVVFATRNDAGAREFV